MLVLTQARLATVEELFRYTSEAFTLDSFPGYTPDQWGIKAHNRPWVAEAGVFGEGQRILEDGFHAGTYSAPMSCGRVEGYASLPAPWGPGTAHD